MILQKIFKLFHEKTSENIDEDALAMLQKYD